MKKAIKIMLVCLLAVMCALSIVACNNSTQPPVEDPGAEDEKLIDYNGTFDKPHNTAYGAEPDLDNVIIDGKLDDELWQNKKWYTNYKVENPNFKFEVTTHMSDGGLYLAARSDDSFLFWNGRNYFFYNTYMKFDFAGSGYSLRVDCNNTPPTGTPVNVRSRYEGKLNAFGEGGGMFAEAFITWDQLGFEDKPAQVKILPSYYWVIKPNVKNNLLASTFVNGAGNANQYTTFDTNGYVDADAPDAKVGSHEYGLAKTNGWKVENPGEDNETITSLTGGSYNGYIKGAFFRKIYNNRFMLKTRVTVNSNTGTTRAGLLMYVDNLKYRAFSVELNNDIFKNDTLINLPVRAYTNYPANITVTTKIGDITPDTGNGRQANQYDLTVFANNGMMYYLVNDKFVYSEEATYIQSAFTGFYAYNADVTFSNYEAKEFMNEEEIKSEISKYVYTVEIKNHNSQAVKGELSQIATANTGNGSIDVNLIFGIGKELKDNKYQRYNITGLYYEVIGTDDENLKHVDIMDEFRKGTAGQFIVNNIPGNIVIHVEGESVTVPTDELVSLKLHIYSPQMQQNVAGVSVSLYGTAPTERYDVSLNKADGILDVKVPKGNAWKFTGTKSGYRAVSGDINGGEPVNADIENPETFNMLSAVVGGVAVSADDAKYNPETGEYEAVKSFQRGSTPGIYWDLSEEESNKVTFTSTNTGSSNIFYSGKTAAEYQVAYVELTNQTDYMAFQSIEDDPGVGFTISTNSGNIFCGLRQTGVRIVPTTNWADHIDVNGLCGWQGGIATIDRNNNGKVLGVSMGTGSVNRVPMDGKTYTTSFLIIRRGGNVYLYAADGRAGVKSDGTNFNKMQLFYKGYIPQATGVAALGFAITVSYNLRVDFENYWILAGQQQASAFADKIISTDLTVSGEKDLIKLTSDGISNYDEETGTGKIALSSEIVVTPKGDIPEGKIIKLTLGDSVSYLNSKDSEGVLTVNSIEKPISVKAELVDAARVTGNINILGDGEVALGGRTGKVLGADGAQLTTFKTESDGYWSVLVEKGAQLTVSVNVDGYAANKMTFTVNGSEYNLGEMVFQKLIIGEKVGSLVTTPGMEYGYDEKYNGAYAHWETSTIGDTVLTLNKEYNNKEDFVLSFSYVRSSAAENGMPATVKDEADLGLGITVNGEDASGIQFLNIGTGYRMLHTSWAGRHEQRGVGRVNFQSPSVKIDNYAQVKIIKKGGMFYLLSKYKNDAEYTMSVAFRSVNDNGVQILEGAVAFAIKMTVTQGTYLNMTLFDINVQEVNKDTAPEIVSVVTVEQPSEGSIAVEGYTEDTFEITGASTVNVIVTPPAEKKVTAVKVNGVAQSLGDYTDGVFTGAVKVSGTAVITAEFDYITYVKTVDIKINQLQAMSVKITNGTITRIFTVSMLPGDLSETVAVISEYRTVTFMAPKGTWTVTLCSDTNGQTAIGKPITSVVV